MRVPPRRLLNMGMSSWNATEHVADIKGDVRATPRPDFPDAPAGRWQLNAVAVRCILALRGESKREMSVGNAHNPRRQGSQACFKKTCPRRPF